MSFLRWTPFWSYRWPCYESSWYTLHDSTTSTSKKHKCFGMKVSWQAWITVSIFLGLISTPQPGFEPATSLQWGGCLNCSATNLHGQNLVNEALRNVSIVWTMPVANLWPGGLSNCFPAVTPWVQVLTRSAGEVLKTLKQLYKSVRNHSGVKFTHLTVSSASAIFVAISSIQFNSESLIRLNFDPKPGTHFP